LILPDLQVQQNIDFMKGRKAFSTIPTVLFLTMPVFLIGFWTILPSKSDKFVNNPGYKPAPHFPFTLSGQSVFSHQPSPYITCHYTSLSYCVLVHKTEQPAILSQQGYSTMDVSLLIKQTA